MRASGAVRGNMLRGRGGVRSTGVLVLRAVGYGRTARIHAVHHRVRVLVRRSQRGTVRRQRAVRQVNRG